MSRLSTSTRSQTPHGGFSRNAEQPVPEQLTMCGSCCRELEPTLSTREQMAPSAPSASKQLATEMDNEEANSGTYNLQRKEMMSVAIPDLERDVARTTPDASYLRRAGLSGAAVC